MSNTAMIDESDALAARLIGEAEGRYRRTYGKRARIVLAGEVGVAPGTIENINRGRHKGLRGRVRDKLMQFVAREIRNEIQRLEHDYQMALRCAARPDEDALCEAKAALDQARRLISKL